MSISALSECGSGAESFAVVERGGGGGCALYESGSGAVHSCRPLPSVIGCQRNMISPSLFLLIANEGPVTEIHRSSVSVDQSQATISAPGFTSLSPLQYGTPLKV